MTFIQMWLFMRNESEPLRQASLLMLLAGGVGHGDSLLQSLHAHQQESMSTWAGKVGQLRMLLEQGHSLAESLSMVSELLPDQTITLIRVAEGTGGLADVLMDEARRLHQLGKNGPTLAGTLERILLWAASLLVGGAAIIVYLIWKDTIPRFRQTFVDFDVSLPESTTLMFHTYDVMCSYGFVFILPVAATVAIGVRMAYSSVCRKLRHGYPPFAEYWPRYWLPGILRTLSLSAAGGQPLGRALDCVMQDLPSGRAAIVVSALRHRVNGGEDAVVAMQSLGLLRRSESAFLHSALRTQHLDWALRHLANSVERRRRIRLARVSQLAMPLAILIGGGAVMLFALAFFAPLTVLIEKLS